ncbi:MAG: class I SAM-dependent methyltransferase [Pirellulales bacterium]|nr:class I SAM-dependent methyltransferase [Pirellulales bacterium]
MSHLEHNRRAWDTLVSRQERHTLAARDEDFADPLATINADGWLGEGVTGKRVLCLAAGGGRHSALYAAAGGVVTVVDLSPAMLALDRAVAAERNLPIRIVETSMDNLRMFATGEFDLVVQPVSTCYVPDILAVYRQVAWVLRPDGVYISQHKSPVSLQCAVEPNAQGRYELREPYYRAGPLPDVTGSPHREGGTLEYLHRWQELIGGLCQAGFVIEDCREPPHARASAAAGVFGHRSQFVAPYIRLKARRVTAGNSSTFNGKNKDSSVNLWLPE